MRAKLDMVLINQSKMNRILLPEEKILSKPSNMPALPLDTIEQVKRFEKFLSNDIQLADTVSNVLHVFMVNVQYKKIIFVIILISVLAKTFFIQMIQIQTILSNVVNFQFN